jgi:hypothetical protein
LQLPQKAKLFAVLSIKQLLDKMAAFYDQERQAFAKGLQAQQGWQYFRR